jgi:hypothetical protein
MNPYECINSTAQITCCLWAALYIVTVGMIWSLLGSPWNGQAVLHLFQNVESTFVASVNVEGLEQTENTWVCVRSHYLRSYKLALDSCTNNELVIGLLLYRTPFFTKGGKFVMGYHRRLIQILLVQFTVSAFTCFMHSFRFCEMQSCLESATGQLTWKDKTFCNKYT